MRSRCFPALLGLAFALAAPAAIAQSAGDAAMPDWDRLSPQQREALIAPIRERWNGDPGQRAKMLDRAQRWREMTPDERKRARHGIKRWKDMSPEKRSEMRALHGQLRALPEGERSALRERWQAMTPEQRRDWVEAHPAPDRPRQP